MSDQAHAQRQRERWDDTYDYLFNLSAFLHGAMLALGVAGWASHSAFPIWWAWIPWLPTWPLFAVWRYAHKQRMHWRRETHRLEMERIRSEYGAVS